MSYPLVRLNFALQSIEDPLSAAMAHTMEYDTLHLFANAQHEVRLVCVLPEDAHEGDIISLNATHLLARDARYCVEHILSLEDIEIGHVSLVLSHIGFRDDSNEYVLQLMLHGLHATLKDSAEFDVIITPHESGYLAPIITNATGTKSHSLRHYFTHFSSSILSFF
ncbi:MAG: hypothetical protein ACPHXV_05740 [Glaciecola sp.]